MSVENKSFYRGVFALLIPLALQNLTNVAVQIADVVMLRPLGEVALSAANLGGQVPFIITLAFFGLASGMVVITAQSWGKQDLLTIKNTLGIAMRFAAIIGLVFFLICCLFPTPIMRIFSSDPQVIAQGAKYLRILSFSYCFSGITVTYLNLMRSLHRVKISTAVFVASLIINIFFNYVLIYGKLGLPALGITGAAIGTLIARISETVMVLIYNRRFNPIFRFKFSYVFTRNRQLSRDFFKYTIPVILNEVLWSAGVAACAAILGQLGSAVSGAYSVVSVVRQLSLVLCIGAANATAVILGKNLGEGRPDLAWRNSKRLLWISFATGIIGAAVVLIIRQPVVTSMTTLSATSRGYLDYMLFLLTVVVLMQSVNCTIVIGVLRSGGDTRMGLLIDGGTLWFGAVLLGFLAAFVFHLPVRTVFAILMCDELLKLGFCIWRWQSKKWIRNVTR